MSSSTSVWRRKLWIWLPAFVLVILNLAFLSTYRFLLAGQAQLRVFRVERAEKELVSLEADQAALEDLLQRAKVNRERVGDFYSRWIASESERLTQVISEVKNLAQRAGVQSSSFNYPEEDLADYGLLRRSIAFSVSGSYSQLRQFVNLIELSDHFLMLEDVRLNESGQGNSTIRVRLRVSSLFLHEPPMVPAEPAAEEGLST
jgi:Tfp pilus assembly protein PilO